MTRCLSLAELEICPGRRKVCRNDDKLEAKSWLKAKSDCIKESIYIDEGFSGKTLDRPGFRQMMQAAKGGELSAVVVYRLDRISRSIGDFAGLIEELGNMGISFVSIREQFDTESPIGRAMMYIASVFSQLERETIAERIRDNMLELSKTGRWLGGTTPTGYVSEEIDKNEHEEKQKKYYRLKVLSQEAVLVQNIFDEFLKSGSLKVTQEWLADKGYVSKNGNPFSRCTLKGILQNPVYARADAEVWAYWKERGGEIFASREAFDGKRGIMVYNRTCQKNGKAHEIREVSDWVIAVGEHEGLVDGIKWTAVQRLLEENRVRRGGRRGEQPSLLAGILYCKGCGAPMRQKLSRNRQGKERRFVYLCTGKEKSKKESCSMKNVQGNQLDKAVIAALEEIPEDERAFRKSLAREQKILGRKSQEQEEMKKISAGFGELLDSSSMSVQRLMVQELIERAEWDGNSLQIYLKGV